MARRPVKIEEVPVATRDQRVVVISDLHLDAETDGHPRFAEIARAVEMVITTLRDDDIFVFAGDLSNPNSKGVHRSVAFAVEQAELMSSRGVRNLWLTGNHDVVEDGYGSHTLMALQELRNGLTIVAASPGIYMIETFPIVCLPFTPATHDYSPTDFVADCVSDAICTRVKLVVGHLNIKGISAGSETKSMPRGRNVFLPISKIEDAFPNATIVNGHYHRKQIFQGVYIPGSMARLRHDEEENEPGYLDFKFTVPRLTRPVPPHYGSGGD